MLTTKMMNSWLGTSYTLEEVAEMPSIVFDVLLAVKQGMEPHRAKEEIAPRGNA